MQNIITTARTKFLHGKEKILKKLEDRKVERIVNNFVPHKIYHYHIRKTGGTTINFAFLSNCGELDAYTAYEKLTSKHFHRLITNEKVFVGWNTDLINEGKYFYAFSHTPAHQLNLPSDIKTITCLRDPVKRVLSHYNMLKYYLTNNIDHPCLATEGKWIGNSFLDFLNSIPKEHLLNQMYMFSENFNINEAVDSIGQCYAFLFTEKLQHDLAILSTKLSLSLPPTRQKEYHHKVEIHKDAIEKLREMLEPEYRMIDQLKLSI